MRFIIPTPEQFADPNSEFNNPKGEEAEVEIVVKNIFERLKKSSSIMYSDIGCPKHDIWKQAVEKIATQGWHIGLKKFPDELMGTMVMPGFYVVCIEPKNKMTEAEFAQSLIVVEEVAS